MLRLNLRVLVAVSVILFGTALTHAQDNLLANPGLEEPYTGRGASDLNIPSSWNLWVGNTPQTESWMNLTPSGFPHRTQPEVQQGRVSLNLSKGFGTFTAAVYQQAAVEEGTNLRASAYAWIHTCGDPGQVPEGGCESDAESGASVRIGIDPNGGTNPNDTDIVWSEMSAPHDQWGQISVDATATADTVTVFLWASQNEPRAFNNLYWDDAALVVGGEGGTAGAPAAQSAPPQAASADSARQEREDGSVVHIVREGETIDSIAITYGLTRQQIMEFNGIADPRIIQIGQAIIVEPADDTGGVNFDEEGAVFEDDATAEPTPVPPTSTPAPTAPVVAAAFGAMNPVSNGAAVCVLMFEDLNQNRIQEAGEALLSGGTINLLSSGVPVSTHQTDGTSEPHCFSELAPGDYVAAASAPDGYGLTTPNQLDVEVHAGVTVHVVYGAAEGVQPVVPPQSSASGAVSGAPSGRGSTRTFSDQLFDMSGLIVFGLAALVLLGGLGWTVLARRR